MTARGLRNNNPGNINKTPAGHAPWRNEIVGMPSNDPRFDARFAVFPTMADGLHALSKLVANYKRLHGIRTALEYVQRYAPAADHNFVVPYAQTIAFYVFGDKEEIALEFDLEDKATHVKVMKAIVHCECEVGGKNQMPDPITDAEYEAAAEEVLA